MSAVDTVQRVLAWASEPQGPAPTGSVAGLRALGAADEQTRELLAELLRRTAARLGAGARPFGDTGAAGPGAVLLAAAVGARTQPAVAERLVMAVPAPASRRHADAVARHGVLRALAPIAEDRAVTRADLDGRLLDAVLNASPLTAVLYRPPADRFTADATTRETDLALDLIAQPRGRACLSAALSGPSIDTAVLAWRTRLLSALRQSHCDAVVEVYLKARLRHGAAWDKLLANADRELKRSGGHAQAQAAVARFWAPLAALERDDQGALRDSPFLEGYPPAIDLLDRFQLTEAER